MVDHNPADNPRHTAAPQHSVTRLSVNLPALERLIGGDSEMEIQLRHQIVEAFATKYLKALVNTGPIQLAISRAEGAMVAEISEKIGRVQDTWDGPKVTLHPEMRERIEQRVRAKICDITDAVIREQSNPAAQFEAMIRDQLAYWKQYADDRIKAAIERAVAVIPAAEDVAAMRATLVAAQECLEYQQRQHRGEHDGEETAQVKDVLTHIAKALAPEKK